MKLHEVKKNERIYIAKKIPGAKLDQHNFTSYRTKKIKTYYAEQCKEITKVPVTRNAIWSPRNGMGIYEKVINLNIDGDKNLLGYSSLMGGAAYIVIDHDNYIALVEPIQMNLWCNISN